jgi:hypothetical protein
MRRSDLASILQHSETEPAGHDAMDRYAVNVVEWCARGPIDTNTTLRDAIESWARPR